MEPDQVHLVAPAVSCEVQQVIHAREPGFTSQIGRDVADRNRRNGIDDDVPLVHPVTATDLDAGARPDANGAPDSSTPDSLANPVIAENRVLVAWIAVAVMRG
jgi:hypothetical protein